MAITDDARTDLHQWCRDAMGEKRAGTLMGLLPPVGWADVATKQDLGGLRTDMTAEFADVRAEMRAEFADVRAEMRAEFADVRAEMRTGLADVRAELRTGLADVRAELHTGLADVRTELRTGLADVRVELHGVRSEFHRALRTTLLAVVATNITLFGLAVATVRLA